LSSTADLTAGIEPGDDRPVLYGYWRSTAAYRVRIALGLKGIAWRHAGVNLVRGGGEQHLAAYTDLNPAALVPTLVWRGETLTQSLAICDFLDEVQPAPALLPAAPGERALARAMAQDIACDTHPLNNLRVQQYLGTELGVSEDDRTAWMHHWMALGFGTVERRIARHRAQNPSHSAGTRPDLNTCLGGQPGLADLCLVAQAYNADRFGFSLEPFEHVAAVVRHCRALPAFRDAAPEVQPDAS
jgi:maleylacetoacetate isomerase